MTIDQNRTNPRTWEFSLRRPPLFGAAVTLSTLLVITLSWIYVASISSGTRSMLSPDSLARMSSFVTELAGSGSSSSFWQREDWRDVIGLVGDTLAMSILASAIAGTAAFVMIPFASSNLMITSRTGLRRWIQIAVFSAVRGLFIFMRSVPELLWALIVVFMISPGILAGALALAIHNIGVIGRLGSDIVEDVEPHSITALKSAGARPVQAYLTGILPQVVRQLLTFQFYRWEVIIRTTAVVGFVAASGLGYQLRLDLNFFRYTNVGQLLVAYILIVWAVDIISTLARRSAR